MEPADPDFYKIGFARSFRAYGVEFREGPSGFGVYASRDVEPLRRARVSLFFCCSWILESGYCWNDPVLLLSAKRRML